MLHSVFHDILYTYTKCRKLMRRQTYCIHAWTGAVWDKTHKVVRLQGTERTEMNTKPTTVISHTHT